MPATFRSSNAMPVDCGSSNFNKPSFDDAMDDATADAMIEDVRMNDGIKQRQQRQTHICRQRRGKTPSSASSSPFTSSSSPSLLKGLRMLFRKDGGVTDAVVVEKAGVTNSSNSSNSNSPRNSNGNAMSGGSSHSRKVNRNIVTDGSTASPKQRNKAVTRDMQVPQMFEDSNVDVGDSPAGNSNTKDGSTATGSRSSSPSSFCSSSDDGPVAGHRMSAPQLPQLSSSSQIRHKMFRKRSTGVWSPPAASEFV